MTLRRQVVLFGLCGLVSAATYASTIVALVDGLGWPTVAATTVGFVDGTLVSWLLNSWLTFQQPLTGRAMGRFWVVTLVGWGLNVACVEGTVALGAHYQLGVLLSLVVAPTFNFLGHRWWTFRSP